MAEQKFTIHPTPRALDTLFVASLFEHPVVEALNEQTPEGATHCITFRGYTLEGYSVPVRVCLDSSDMAAIVQAIGDRRG